MFLVVNDHQHGLPHGGALPTTAPSPHTVPPWRPFFFILVFPIFSLNMWKLIIKINFIVIMNVNSILTHSEI